MGVPHVNVRCGEVIRNPHTVPAILKSSGPEFCCESPSLRFATETKNNFAWSFAGVRPFSNVEATNHLDNKFHSLGRRVHTFGGNFYSHPHVPSYPSMRCHMNADYNYFNCRGTSLAGYLCFAAEPYRRYSGLDITKKNGCTGFPGAAMMYQKHTKRLQLEHQCTHFS